MSFRQSKTSDEEEKNKKYDPRGIMKYLLDEKEVRVGDVYSAAFFLFREINAQLSL